MVRVRELEDELESETAGVGEMEFEGALLVVTERELARETEGVRERELVAEGNFETDTE